MKKDVDMGIFFEDDERYADAVNVFGNMPEGTVTENAVEPYDTKLLFNGGAFHLPRPLTNLITAAKHRDMARRIIFGVNFVIAELEFQETVDYSYPLRDMVYTCGEYEKQARKIRRMVRRAKKKSLNAAKPGEELKESKIAAKPVESLKKLHLRPGEYLYGFRKESRLRPTVIFLLYFGEEPWYGPICIHDMLDFTDIPEKIKALVQNHHINLIDVRRMSDEMLDRFQTDVGKVLRIIKNAENKKELKRLVENDPYYKEMEQDAYLVTANYIDAEELLDYEKYEEGGKCNMCRAIKELIEDGRMEGRREERVTLLVDLVHDNVINVKEAAKRMGITEKEFLEKMNEELQSR